MTRVIIPFPVAGGYLRQLDSSPAGDALPWACPPAATDGLVPSLYSHSSRGPAGHGTDPLGGAARSPRRGAEFGQPRHSDPGSAQRAHHSKTDAVDPPPASASPGATSSLASGHLITPAEWFDFAAQEQIARADRLNADDEHEVIGGEGIS